jgi:hypothetical protein
MKFVASHKHEHLKVSSAREACLQDVLALAGGACVMVPNQSSS